jgi:aminoglycoside phosphotransferase (APT) family kinase protein
MSIIPSADKPEISLSLVNELVVEQFPQWAHLRITTIKFGGIDNKTYRLGDEMLIRLPSAEGYAGQVQKEQEWLPKIAPHLTTQIPEPIAMGISSKQYPWNWSIYKWIEGGSANTLHIDNHQLLEIAKKLAQFLRELQKIDTTGGPAGGLHNYYRGAHPSVYDVETRSAISKLQGLIDADKATAIWEKAINSKWHKQPVWIHGDVASGNILVNQGELAAVIDFGCMGIGDPACDLVIAWTLLKNESRKIFKEEVGLDTDTWDRARGWALWKASIELVSLQNKTSSEAMKRLEIINQLLK